MLTISAGALIAHWLVFPARPVVFNEEAAINIVLSTLHDNAGSINNNYSITFNPIEKWLAALEENKNLYDRYAKGERLND